MSRLTILKLGASVGASLGFDASWLHDVEQLVRQLDLTHGVTPEVRQTAEKWLKTRVQASEDVSAWLEELVSILEQIEPSTKSAVKGRPR
jgi:hypothetical protein